MKRFITDEEAIKEMDFMDAQLAFVELNAQWEQEHRHGRDFMKEWNLAEKLWAAEERLIALFTSGDRRLNPAYSQYRKRLLFHHARQA